MSLNSQWFQKYKPSKLEVRNGNLLAYPGWALGWVPTGLGAPQTGLPPGWAPQLCPRDG